MAGEPWEIKKAVCLHEEDAGILWKHMEYRNGHAEVRRSRRLVLSFVATVVNYEYCFYWHFYQVQRSYPSCCSVLISKTVHVAGHACRHSRPSIHYILLAQAALSLSCAPMPLTFALYLLILSSACIAHA